MQVIVFYIVYNVFVFILILIKKKQNLACAQTQKLNRKVKFI